MKGAVGHPVNWKMLETSAGEFTVESHKFGVGLQSLVWCAHSVRTNVPARGIAQRENPGLSMEATLVKSKACS
jgi:hypothetical protein